MAEDYVPRRTVDTDPAAALMSEIRRLNGRVDALERQSTFRNASISGGGGLRVLDADGKVRLTINTADGAVVALDDAGEPAARYGPLANTNPGHYGVEVKVGDTWVQVGAETVTWDNVAGKPNGGNFSYAGHKHPGTDITSTVASATTAATAGSAGTAGHADDAAGSAQAFNNDVAGSTFYAVWVGDAAGNTFGRNVSSLRYKTNVRDHPVDPDKVLQLRPVLYDRKSGGAVNEYGLIAEEVNALLPELVVWFDGQIDGVRYDLVCLALLDVLKQHAADIAALKGETP